MRFSFFNLRSKSFCPLGKGTPLLLLATLFIMLFPSIGITTAFSLEEEKEIISIGVEGNNEVVKNLLLADLKNILSSRFVVTDTMAAGHKHLLIKFDQKLITEDPTEEIMFQTRVLLYAPGSNTPLDLTNALGQNRSMVELLDLPVDILHQINTLYLIPSTILSLENKGVIVDIGSNIGIKEGDRLDVFNPEEKKAGLLEVTGVRKLDFEAKVIRGKPKVGYLVRRKELADLGSSVGVKYTFYPSKLEPSPTYIAASGRVPPVIDNLGYRILLTYRLFIEAQATEYLGRWDGGIEFSSGYIKIGPRQGWNIINADIAARIEMMPERLFLEVFHVEIGMSIIGGRLEWARSPGTYKDKLSRDSGFVEVNTVYNGGLGAGCTFYLNRSVSLSANIGGTFFMTWSSFWDADAPQDEKEGYEIDDKWLEYDLRGVGSLELQSAIKIWF